MHKPYILYRSDSLEATPELQAIQKYFPDTNGNNPQDIPHGSQVFTRFRSIPFGEYLEQEVNSQGSTLINTWEQYQYISDLKNWADDFHELTPAVYTVNQIDTLPEGEYFVKGVTNSIKSDWDVYCYAPTLAKLPEIIRNVQTHPVVGNQEIIIRPFIHYRQLGVMDNTQPLLNEWRVFVLNGHIVGTGYYWSQQLDTPPTALNPQNFQDTIQEAIQRVGNKAHFVVFDLAELPDGTWQVIELNDANMSGLCGVDPNTLWKNIANRM